MSRVAYDPYEKVMKRHGFTDEFRRQVIEARRIERAERLRVQEIDRARHSMCEHSVPQWVRELVIAVAQEFGVSPSDVYSDNRYRDVVHARQAAVYRVKQTKPKLSLSMIGKWFCRDHTTIAHSLAVYSRRFGMPALTAYDLDAQRTQAMNWYLANRRQGTTGDARNA